MKPFFLFRYFAVLTALALVINQAHASGAKRPDVESSGEVSVNYPVVIPPDVSVQDPVNVNSDQYSHLDPDHIVPSALLTKALNFYKVNQGIIKNKRYIGVIDFKQHNSKKRFYLIDMESGDVDQYLTAHGKNSDPDFDGYATTFSNTPDSLMSSLGFYLTAETYYGAHDYSLRLDGLSSTNSNARARAIVIHGADYVREVPLIGRSFGCPALDLRYSTQVIDMIKGGALLYAE